MKRPAEPLAFFVGQSVDYDLRWLPLDLVYTPQTALPSSKGKWVEMQGRVLWTKNLFHAVFQVLKMIAVRLELHCPIVPPFRNHSSRRGQFLAYSKQ